MSALVEQVRRKLRADVFTDTELVTLLGGTPARRHAITKRAVASGRVIRLRRGLFCVHPDLALRPPDLFVLAGLIHGPSYVSLESALAHHGWIPEAVYATTSVCMDRARSVRTALGTFVYRRVSCRPFLTAVERAEVPQGAYYVASPWRALADLVHVERLSWRSLAPIVESLRVDEGLLARSEAHVAAIDSLIPAFRSRRVRVFLEGVRKELKP